MVWNLHVLGIALLITMGSACASDEMDGEGGTGSSTSTGDDGGTEGGETGSGTGECEQFLPDEPGQAVTFELHNERDQPIYVESQTSCASVFFGLDGPDDDLRWPVDTCESTSCEDMIEGVCPTCDCYATHEMIAPGAKLTAEFSGNLFEPTTLPQGCAGDAVSCPAGACVVGRQAPSGSYDLFAKIYGACDPGDDGASVCDCEPGDGTCPLFGVGTLSDEERVSQAFTHPDTGTVVLAVE